MQANTHTYLEEIDCGTGVPMRAGYEHDSVEMSAHVCERSGTVRI